MWIWCKMSFSTEMNLRWVFIAIVRRKKMLKPKFLSWETAFCIQSTSENVRKNYQFLTIKSKLLFVIFNVKLFCIVFLCTSEKVGTKDRQETNGKYCSMTKHFRGKYSRVFHISQWHKMRTRKAKIANVIFHALWAHHFRFGQLHSFLLWIFLFSCCQFIILLEQTLSATPQNSLSRTC